MISPEVTLFQIEIMAMGPQVTYCDTHERLVSQIRARLRNGEFTERSLARRLGISQSHVNNVLRGRRKLSHEVADVVLKIFNVGILDLYTEPELDTHLSSRTLSMHPAKIQFMNEILTFETAERKRIESELTADLSAMTRLHEFSIGLLQRTELLPVLQEVLDAMIAVQEAEFATIQLCNTATNSLEFVLQRPGEDDPSDFNRLNVDEAHCSRALRERRRVVVDELSPDADVRPYPLAAASAGSRAVLFTPMFGNDGQPLGVISTCFRGSHRYSDRQLRLADLYTRTAAAFIDRQRNDAAVRAGEAHFRAVVRSLSSVTRSPNAAD